MTHNVGLLVLGCTVMPDGTPSDWLTDRLEATLVLIESFSRNAAAVPNSARLALHVVLSGGSVRHTITEASVMRAWLQSHLCAAGAAVVPTDGAPAKTTRLLLPCPLVAEAPLLPRESAPLVPAGRTPGPETTVEVVLQEEDEAQDTVGNIVLGLNLLQQLFTLRRHGGSHDMRPHLHDLWLVSSDFHVHRGCVLLQRELLRVTSGIKTSRGEADDYDTKNVAALPRPQFVSELFADATTLFSVSRDSASTLTQLRCLAAFTPTLQEPALSERRKRESMLTNQNLEQHRNMFADPTTSSA